MFSAYILKSTKDNKFYYGHTADFKLRLLEHNRGKVKATKNRRPLNLHYFEIFSSRSEAVQRELFFKSISGYLYLKENKII
jgi:putative endonuclease